METEGDNSSCNTSSSITSSHTATDAADTLDDPLRDGGDSSSDGELSASAVGGDDYDKPATLSAAHLNAILFSCENISTAASAAGTTASSEQLNKHRQGECVVSWAVCD